MFYGKDHKEIHLKIATNTDYLIDLDKLSLFKLAYGGLVLA